MQFDTHVHSLASPDSEMRPADAIKTLNDQGLGVIFTEHVDYVTPVEGRDFSAADAPKSREDFIADFTRYPCEYLDFRCDTVGLGLEIGLNDAFLPLNRQTAAGGDWDFIIGSVHHADGYGLERGEYYREVADPYLRLLHYTREMAERSDFFDALGHIDYISRYSPFCEKNVLYENYADAYESLFRVLVKNEKILELNTARLGDTAAERNLYQIYRQYRQAGGRYVTLGSDAHEVGDLARNFDRALRMARDVELTPVYFKQRKMIFCK